jgi:hypothetical protein
VTTLFGCICAHRNFRRRKSSIPGLLDEIKGLFQENDFPSLVQDLARNVDPTLKAASKTLPSLGGFITAKE